MRHLNYSHLQYFWAVAREGSMASAAKAMHITPQTISGQLKLLEESLGSPLFNRVGRRLELTELGHTVFEYADEIFTIGNELANVVRGQEQGSTSTLKVGMVSSMPKLIAERIIAPAYDDSDPVRVRCHEASLGDLLGDLATHRLDLVLSDQPMQHGLSMRAYSHKLGDSGMSFFARRDQAERFGGVFPACLNGKPMLLPTTSTALRRRLDDWFDINDISPVVVGEFDDSALMKAFGEAGIGVFVGPSVIEDEILRMYDCVSIGRTQEIEEHFYVISPERRLKHPAVVRIIGAARSQLFTETERAA
ncbi:MAG: transcriptional activator NhaR [Pseudomonadota bacterium]